MARQRIDLETMCRGIEQAGSVDAYVDSQLRERGFLVERRATDNMSKRELARYKKELKEEDIKTGIKDEIKEETEDVEDMDLGEDNGLFPGLEMMDKLGCSFGDFVIPRTTEEIERFEEENLEWPELREEVEAAIQRAKMTSIKELLQTVTVKLEMGEHFV